MLDLLYAKIVTNSYRVPNRENFSYYSEVSDSLIDKNPLLIAFFVFLCYSSARLVKMGTSAEGENKYAGNTRARRSANDFMFGKLIGEGSFSVVYLAKDVHTSKEWAGKFLVQKNEECHF